MSIFKCKMCGGDLEISEGVTIAECEYCGTKQTVPKVMDENLQNLFNRANTLRIKSEFDKAEKLYEKIIQADSTQAEAYWGLILCKYGIEYVDDPATFKKIPTCHRASYDSVVADDDYKSAIENADAHQRAIYEEQAKEIDRIQKDILALAQKEESYDVFICYKETDSDGKRTQDSVIANDIYYQLTQEGFKVFYSAITLEGKLGSAYEPIIFAALNSAKVMLVLGTKPEYFNAVWVKNEWSRFLKIIKKDRTKILIPCYRDMDAYELPEEFAHLQAQDMSKIGFINDVVRGIKKVATTDEPKTTVVKETVTVSGNTNTAPLLERAFIFLEDGEWDSADEYCEKVLDIDPKCASAYLGKLMTELRVKKQENLKDCTAPFDSSSNYQKAVRFGDDALKQMLTGCTEYIKDRNENARLESIYSKAHSTMIMARSENSYRSAASMFSSIIGYKDANELANQCLEDAEVARKDSIYSEAIDCIETFKKHVSVASLETALEWLGKIQGYKDADELLDKYTEELKRAKEAAEIKAKRSTKICLIVLATLVAIIFVFSLIKGIYDNAKQQNIEAKYEYVNANKNNDDLTTFEYLKELKDAEYKDSASIYKELYGWKITSVFNTSKNDSTTNKKSISRYDPLYCHITLSGGEPNEEATIKYTLTFPDGKTDSDTFDEKWTSGDSGTVWFEDGLYVNPEYGTLGKLYVHYYVNDTYVGVATVEITK